MFRRRKLRTFNDLRLMKERLDENGRIVTSADGLIARYRVRDPQTLPSDPDTVNVSFAGTSFQVPRTDLVEALQTLRRHAVDRRREILTDFERIGVQP